MNKHKLFKLFLDIKKNNKLETIDAHMHPFDVLGIKRITYTTHKERINDTSIPKPTLLEYLEYNNLAIYLLKFIFYVAPNFIRHNICSIFDDTNEKKLISEMKDAGIDKGVLLPVEPFVKSDDIYKNYLSENFIRLGSVDIHNIPYKEIEKNIDNQILKFKIVGIKLHPNIQNFFPQPSMNKSDMTEKLNKIYRVAEDRKLFLLFHTGISYIFYPQKKKVEYAILENFCDKNGKSEVFNYNIPIIIAHMGSYNIIKPNFDLLNIITKNYKNVFFDTSGVNPKVIAKAIEIIGIDKIIFGSDANYYRIKFSLQLTLKALRMAHVKENLQEKITKVFSHNFIRNILNIS